MKKLKLLLPVITTSFVVSTISALAITSCSCSNETTQVSSVELSKEVIAKGVSLNTFNIQQNKLSTIVLNLPNSTTISGISIKVGSTTLKTNDVNIVENTISIPATKMTVVNIIISTITLKQPEPEPEKSVDFNSCSWSEIDKWCQQLENNKISESEFCSHFLVDGKALSSMEDFVGLEKTIMINNVNHVIRVIGTLQDPIANTNTKAALTFELVTLLSNSDGNAILSASHDQPLNFDYPNIVIRANLCGSGTATKTWDKTALQMLEETCSDLANVIKPTVHTIATADHWTGGTIIQTEYIDKLFIPGYYNVTSKQSPYCKETENSIYQYYSYLETLTEEEAKAGRVKTDANGNSNWYWLASAYTYYGNDAWRIKEDGEIHYKVNQVAAGVSFAFSI